MQHLQPNTTLQGGKYRITRVLGQGGFGITYLAEQSSLGRYVAIKEFFMKDFCLRADDTRSVSTPTTGSRQQVEQYRRKFVKEAHNLAQLNHPNIINIIEVFEENGTVYYSMPYLPGGSLQDYVKIKGALSEAEAMKYIRQIASALKYMHMVKHLCHYDVKPANILLDNNGNAILIDFGISKHYDGRDQETTTTPVGLSEGYAPIEQYQQNVDEFSPASDVYALGATLFYLLHGNAPVNAPSRAGGTALLMKNTLSPNIKSIINASMKISKAERAKSMDVFLIANYVQSAVENERTIIADTTSRRFSQNSEETIVSRPASSTFSSEPSRANNSGGSSFIGWIIGIAVVLLIAFLVIWNKGNETDTPIIKDSNKQVQVTNIQNGTSQNQNHPSKTEETPYDFSGSWICPDYNNSEMNISLVLKYNSSRDALVVDYLVNVRLWDYDMAIVWTEGNTLHVRQAPDDDGNFIEIVAKPVNNKRIEGTLRYKNSYNSYNGELVMDRDE